MKYGGTERVISTLTEELVRRGHGVTLFATADSMTSGRLAPIAERALWRQDRYEDALPFLIMELDSVYSQAGDFDVIHNHGILPALAASRLRPHPPTVTTLHGRLDLPEYQPLFNHFRSAALVAISDAQRAPLPMANWVATVHHGLDLNLFPFNPRAGSYLAFVGRMAPEKGVDTAIRVARRAGLPLRLAARSRFRNPTTPRRSAIGSITVKSSSHCFASRAWNTWASWKTPPRSSCWPAPPACSFPSPGPNRSGW